MSEMLVSSLSASLGIALVPSVPFLYFDPLAELLQ